MVEVSFLRVLMRIPGCWEHFRYSWFYFSVYYCPQRQQTRLRFSSSSFFFWIASSGISGQYISDLIFLIRMLLFTKRATHLWTRSLLHEKVRQILMRLRYKVLLSISNSSLSTPYLYHPCCFLQSWMKSTSYRN